MGLNTKSVKVTEPNQLTIHTVYGEPEALHPCTIDAKIVITPCHLLDFIHKTLQNGYKYHDLWFHEAADQHHSNILHSS